MKQKKRSEIDLVDTWDLTLIFKNDAEFEKSLKETQKEISKISDYKGRILESSDRLLSFLELTDEIECRLYKLDYYAH